MKFFFRLIPLYVLQPIRTGISPEPAQSRTQSPPISYPESRLLGQRFGRQERLWGNGIFSIFLIGYSGNNEIGEAEVGSMLTLPSTMSRTPQETSAIFQRGQQVTLLVRDWRISIHLQHLLVSAFG